MTENEYRSHPAVSRSELWKFHESPQKFKYFKDHPSEPTQALLFGQVFHKLALEPDDFSREYAVAPTVDKRTSAGKEEWRLFLDELGCKTVVTPDMYQQAAEMVKALYEEPLAVKLLDGIKETSFFWADEQTGEQCKCRTDCLNTSYRNPIIVDLKSAADASTETFSRDAVKYGYDLQAFMYSDGVRRNIGAMPIFVFIVVEKTPPYSVNILQADELFLQRGQLLFREYIEAYRDCKASDNWWGYLGKDNLINNLSLPAWAAKELT